MEEVKIFGIISDVLFLIGAAAALLAAFLWKKFRVGQILKEHSDRRKRKKHFLTGASFSLAVCLAMGMVPGFACPAAASDLTVNVSREGQNDEKQDHESQSGEKPEHKDQSDEKQDHEDQSDEKQEHDQTDEEPDEENSTAEDVTPPEISLKFEADQPLHEKYFRNERIAHLTIKEQKGGLAEEKVREELAACITAQDSQGRPVAFDPDQSMVWEDWQPLSDSEQEEGCYRVTVTFSEDAAYSWQPQITDEAGNRSEPVRAEGEQAPFEFTVDRTAPDISVSAVGKSGRQMEWTSLAGQLRAGFSDRTAIEISRYASDDTSPLDEILYYLDPGDHLLSEQELDQVKEWKPFETLELEPDLTTVLYARVTDLAGNIRYISSEGIILDSRAPLIEVHAASADGSIEGEEEGNRRLFRSDVRVSISAEEDQSRTFSGIRQISCRVWNAGQETQNEILFQDDRSLPDAEKKGDRQTDTDPAEEDHGTESGARSGLVREWSGSFLVDSSLNNTNDVRVEVTAEDRAGNETVSSLELGIDLSQPLISISFDHNSPSGGRYYRQSRKAVITVEERNFDPELFRLNLSNSYGQVPFLSEWTEIHKDDGREGGIVHRAEVLFEEDGDYSMDVSCRDRAGNESGRVHYEPGTENPREFVIDRTLPQIQVSYDQNNPTEGFFFREARQAEIRVRERNFDPELFEADLQARLDGKNIEKPEITWLEDADPLLHTGRIVFEKDGDYKLSFSDTDLAGNSSRETDYGESRAAQAFTIDRTIAKPTVRGAADRTSYRGNLFLEVKFEDLHYDSSRISLIRKEQDGTETDVSSQLMEDRRETARGVSCRSKSFGILKDQDGIYFFRCSFRDRAGNQVDSELAFTVNRFGSIYVYGDYLNTLTDQGGAYVKKIREDLVIQEYNADPLLPDSLKTEITCDGKPLEGPAFTVEKLTGKRFGSWTECRWTLKKENFGSDGFYKVMVTSTDAAGNSRDSTLSGLPEIRFHVDARPPELLSVTGLEKAEVYTPSQSVSFEAYDTQGLKQVQTLVDGEEIRVEDPVREDPSYYSAAFRLSARKEPYHVRIRMEDLAGNVTDTDQAEFTGIPGFTSEILVTADPVTRAAIRVFPEIGRGMEEKRTTGMGANEEKQKKRAAAPGKRNPILPSSEASSAPAAVIRLLLITAAALLSIWICRKEYKRKKKQRENEK